MPTEKEVSIVGLHHLGIEHIRKRWGWLLGLGILLAILGSVLLGHAFLATVFALVFVGWLIALAGALQSVHAFACREWGGFFVDLLTGLLYLAVGFMIIANPAATAVTLTLLIALFLIFGGLFRVAVALLVRFHNWIWLLLHGVVNLALGIMIWRQWPSDGLWVIGAFVGIDMIFNAWSLIMLALAVKNLPNSPDAV